MLQTLSIKNFAIIESLSVDFSSGLTVLTGETGAGKSIIIDALSLLAGSRGSSDYIRHGQSKSVLQAQYTLPNDDQLKQLLLDNGIDCDENSLIIYRELHRSGKNVVRVNGTLINVNTLKNIGNFLIDIHGQHEHQYLMNEQYHLQLLDQFGKNELDDSLVAYQQAYRVYTTSKKELKALLTSQQQDNTRIEELKRLIKRIEDVNPKLDEDSALFKQYEQLVQKKEQYDAFVGVAGELFHEDNDVLKRLDGAMAYLNQASKDNATILDTKNMLLDMSEQLKGVSKQVMNVLDDMSFDEEEFVYVSTRLAQLEALKEAFQLPLNDIVNQLEQLQQELDVLQHTDKYIVKAQESFLNNRKALEKIGKQLHVKRQEVANVLCQTIQNQLADLYMDKVLFKVHFVEQNKITFKKNGIDDVVFYAATNVGEPFKPLAKVASGGELSRMMLAMKTVFLKQQAIDTVVFDEIDTGVSGRVAQAIANKMALISWHTQVLAITHLPQVAAMAHAHAFVAKSVVDERTVTTLTYLDDVIRQEEIAKMFAGEDVSHSALQHAQELLQTSQQFKTQLK